jgi:hypothetical protein
MNILAPLIGIVLALFLLTAAVEDHCTKYGEFDFSPYNLVIECSVKGNTDGEAE